MQVLLLGLLIVDRLAEPFLLLDVPELHCFVLGCREESVLFCRVPDNVLNQLLMPAVLSSFLDASLRITGEHLWQS